MGLIERLGESYQQRKLKDSPDNPIDALKQMLDSGDIGPYRGYPLRNQLYAVNSLSETGSQEALQVLQEIYTPASSREIVGQTPVAFLNPDTFYKYEYDVYQVYPLAKGRLGEALKFKIGEGSYDDLGGDIWQSAEILSWEDMEPALPSHALRFHKVMQTAIKSLEDKLATKE